MSQLITLDFETHYVSGSPSKGGYSLRTMTPVEYILDPRFEMIGCAVMDPRFRQGQPVFLDAEQFAVYVKWLTHRGNQGERLTVASHNALFDMSVLAWRYGLVPHTMIDTMGMSRAMLIAFTGYVSLEKVAEYLGLPAKGTLIKNMSGMRAADIKATGQWDAYATYAKHDAWLCNAIFWELMRRGFPRGELTIIDMLLRMVVDPMFQIDTDLLAQHAHDIEAHKQRLLVNCGMTSRADLMSNEKFAEALRLLGIEPGTKVSLQTGEITYAFAKSDPFMVDLAEHTNPHVQSLVAARVGHKSTIEQTRTDRLLRIADCEFPGRGKGWMPIPLRYSGAHTHRLSGDWKLNPQNWSKKTVLADGTKEVGKLRRAHKAPPGHQVVKCDAAQIEARIVAWLAGQEDLVEAFRQKRDIYSEFATEEIYHRPISKKDEDERFVGKNTILGAGFGMGPPKFKANVAAISFIVLGRSVLIDLETAQTCIGGYRRRYPKIPLAWKWLNNNITTLARFNSGIEFGPVKFEHQAILLPNGLRLYYNDLRWSAENGGEWVFTYAQKRKRLFGGKLFENIVQALARIITMDAAVRMQTIYPGIGRLRHQVHDDLVYIVPDPLVEEFKARLEHEMSSPQSWYAGLPLAAEAASGPNYGDAR